MPSATAASTNLGAQGRRLSVIVGASRGIGRHLAQRAYERGDEVVACARSGDELAAWQHVAAPDAAIVVGDFLAADANFEALAQRVAAHAGPASLIISAATIGPVGPLTRIDIESWAAALAANVVGTARIIAALTPTMSADDLVVVFSGGGVGGPNPQPNVSSYTTSKAALMHLIEVAARENLTGPALIAIAPGAFPTGFTDPVLAADAELAGAALLEDVVRTKAGQFDAGPLEALLDYLESGDVHWLSGRTLSAKWDGPDMLRALTEAGTPDDDLYKVRRVDGTGVTVVAW